MKYLIFNFKENKVLNEYQLYDQELRRIGVVNFNLIICPTMPFLHCFKGNNYSLGTQDISRYPEGSYTGEISAKQVASMGVKYTLVGHSERREYALENNSDLINKIGNGIAHGISSIFCIGESLEEYKSGKTFQVLEEQIARVLNNFTREELKCLIIAYEPVWAISSSLTPTNNEIEENIAFIKKIINEYYELNLPVLYGGSVNEKNILNLLKIPNIDGFLVGSASLDMNQFFTLIECFKELRH